MVRVVGVVVIAVFSALAAFPQQYTISTFAGGGPLSAPARATAVGIGVAATLVSDASGNIYFTSLNCAFKIDTNGILTQIAGNLRNGFTGDGGPAASAQLNNPQGSAVDAAGNLYIADLGNNRVRKISPNGTISSVAGNGTAGFSGDGGAATLAQLLQPIGVAVDGTGNLYIAEVGNRRVRKVSPNGIIITVAGGTSAVDSDGGPATDAAFSRLMGVATDAAGNLYLTDWGANRIRKVSTGGIITTVAGNGQTGFSGDGGLATSAKLNRPTSASVDAAGNLYIADSLNNRVRVVSTAGIISTAAGGVGSAPPYGDGGAATSATLASPQAVASDPFGNLYIADGNPHNVIRKVSSTGVITTFAGNGQISGGLSGDGGPAAAAQLSGPQGVSVDPSGNVFIADSSNSVIRKVTPIGNISTVAGSGTFGFSGDAGPATSAQLYGPYAVTTDAAGNLYIADTGNSRVRKVSLSGVIGTIAGNGSAGFGGDNGPAISAQMESPQGVAVDAGGNLYISDLAVRKVTPEGIISHFATATFPYGAVGVAVDTLGNVFFADSGGGTVRKVSPSGVITTVAGTTVTGSSGNGDGGPATEASFNLPTGIAVDIAGNLFIADSGNFRIRLVSAATGIITTIAGNGSYGFSGDGGPATSASLSNPTGVAVDRTGNVYIADAVNNVILVLKPTSVPSPPVINTHGVVESAVYNQLVTPGGIVSVFGSNLASSSLNASTIPLPTTLGGVSLTLGGKTMPLFYASPNQINAQIPWELAGLSTAAIAATTPAGVSVGQSVGLGAVSPGVFTVDSSGTGQGVVTISSTGQLAVPATPAPRGQYITIYCAGLGQVSNPPATGAAALASPLSSTPTLPTVTIGGLPASVSFSGLVPGLVGLYQVNALIPSSVAPGPSVSLELQMNGHGTSLVRIAVQ